MKVMHVIHGLNTGGAETLVKEYVTKMDKKKFDVVVLCYEHRDGSPYEKIIKEAGIKVIYVCDYIKSISKKKIIKKIYNKMQRYLLIKKYINQEKPDIIHSHLRVNNYIKFARPDKKTRIFYTVHSEPKKFWKTKSDSDYKAAKWLVKNYKMTFICLHEKMKEEINEMYKVNNSIVLNNGIDISRYNVNIDIKKARKSIGIPSDSYVVGHIGRFSKVKNHEFLVDIFSEIIKNNKRAFLLMIGDGTEINEIKSKLHKLELDNKYLILSNRNDVPNLLKLMDVFIFPSLYEGLGISLIEAQISRLPCFVSDRVPKAAVISNLVTSLSLDSSPKDWANKVLKYKNINKIKIEDTNWDIEKIVEQLEKIYLDTRNK